MADTKISALPAATIPLAGTEVLPIVQGGTTDRVSVANLTAGRSVSATSFVPSGSSIPANGLYLPAANSLGFAANSTQRFYLDSSGWVRFTQLTATTYIGDASGISGGSAGQSCIRADGNAITFAVGGSTERARINSSGDYIPSTAGRGINFTANTPAAGMTSQLLNWYEEGNWTPTVTATSGTITATNQGSRYTRIGKLVTAYSYLSISSVSSPSGTLTIGGLPFTNGAQYAACLLTLFGGSFTQSVGGYVDASTKNIVATNLDANTAAAGGNIMVSASYMVA